MDLRKKAELRLAAVETEMMTLSKEAERLRSFLAVAEDLESDHELGGRPSARVNPVDEEKREHSSPGAVEAEAIEIIKAAGRPVARAEMVTELQRRGIVLGGKEPRRNLSTILWRSKTIENINGVGYWLPSLGSWSGIPSG